VRVKTDGTVACWDENSAWQATPPPGTFRQVSVGSSGRRAFRALRRRRQLT
jgi:hypothetical protein